jgi:spermidine synthase
VLIRLSVLVSGAVLMAMEILAFLINATTFGSAWREMTAVIAVFLAAMSVGYWLGGVLGDRVPHPVTLVATMAGAAAFVALIPGIASPVKSVVFSSMLPEQWHGLIAASLIYFVPTALLAATSPIGIRLLARSVGESGTVAGGIAALSTVGSIGGTVGTGYFLIESFRVYSILYMLALAVLGMTALFAIAHRKDLFKTLVVTMLLAVVASSAWGEDRILYEAQSLYHHILVLETAELGRQLRFDNTVQGMMNPDDPYAGFFEYVDYAYCPLLFTDDIERVLVIGLASGSVTKRFLRDFPKVYVDVVEIDPKVVEVTSTFFGLTPDPRLSIYVQDGRVFLNRANKRYDVIVVDAYAASRYGLVIPRHLATREFLEEASSRLSANGALVYNVATFLTIDNGMTRSIARTLQAVFPSVYAWEVRSTSSVVFVALPTRHVKTREELVARAKALVDTGKVKQTHFPERVARLRTQPYRAGYTVLLTDQFAPVERLMRR